MVSEKDRKQTKAQLVKLCQALLINAKDGVDELKKELQALLSCMAASRQENAREKAIQAWSKAEHCLVDAAVVKNEMLHRPRGAHERLTHGV